MSAQSHGAGCAALFLLVQGQEEVVEHQATDKRQADALQRQIPILTVTTLYPLGRWIELFFERIEQHLRIRAFLGTAGVPQKA